MQNNNDSNIKEIFLVVIDKAYGVYKAYKGEVIGAVLGALFAIIVLVVGFWKTIFIGICTFVGFYLGRKFSSRDRIIDILDRILPR